MYIREFIKSKENVFKLCNSIDMKKQIKRYPNGSQVLLQIKCKKSKEYKRYLHNLFKINFTQKTYYGSDYFEGNKDDMISEINKYVFLFNNIVENN